MGWSRKTFWLLIILANDAAWTGGSTRLALSLSLCLPRVPTHSMLFLSVDRRAAGRFVDREFLSWTVPRHLAGLFSADW